MLRTLVIVLALAVPMTALPGVAAAQQGQFRDSAIGAEVVSDTGDVVGRVDQVVRDSRGRIVSAEISEQEPASAPYASEELVASADRNTMVLVADRRDDLRARTPSRERPARAR